jgi:hypothetical protein
MEPGVYHFSKQKGNIMSINILSRFRTGRFFRVFVLFSLVTAISVGVVVLSRAPRAHAGSMTVTVSIPNNFQSPLFGNELIGVNAPVYDGVAATAPGATNPVSALLSQAYLHVLRYPGGGTADTYHFATNSVDLGSNIPSSEQSYAAPNFAFDEFMNTVQASHTQADVVVDYGDGTPQEAADWVSYANKNDQQFVPTTNTPLPTNANGLSSGGHAYGVKYWEIGNEIYGDGTYNNNPWEWNSHTHGPAAYGQGVVQFSQAMKNVDSTIKVGAVLTAPGNWPDGVTNSASPQSWNDTVLGTQGVCNVTNPAINFVSVHWYPQQPGNEGGNDSILLGSPENGTSTSPSIQTMLSGIHSELNAHCGANASKIEIQFTEVNSTAYNIGSQTVDFGNAAFLDDSIMTLLEDPQVSSVDWFDLYNAPVVGYNEAPNPSVSYGTYGVLSDGQCAQPGNTPCPQPALNTPYPAYFGLQMIANMFPCGGFCGSYGLENVSSNGSLSIHAALWGGSQKYLIIMIDNKDPNTTYTLNINLPPGHSINGTSGGQENFAQGWSGVQGAPLFFSNGATTFNGSITGPSTIRVFEMPVS